MHVLVSLPGEYTAEAREPNIDGICKILIKNNKKKKTDAGRCARRKKNTRHRKSTRHLFLYNRMNTCIFPDTAPLGHPHPRGHHELLFTINFKLS